EFTIFELVDSDLSVIDSLGYEATLHKLFEPRMVVLGTETIAASRYQPVKPELVNHRHTHSYR
ncbi:hypothetical protein LXJ59_29510, partial [Escherichia coli]|nr:hypothetical protein [Escherichia coli]